MIAALVLSLLLATGVAVAEDEPRDEPSRGMIEGTQTALSNAVIGLSRGIDRFMGTEAEYEDADYDSLLRMSTAYRHDATGNDYDMSLGGSLSLPGTEDRLQLVFESDDPDDPAERDRETAREDEDERARQYFGLRFLNPFRYVESETSFRIPSRLPVDMRSRLRVWRDFEAGAWRIRPRATLFNSRASGTGHTWDIGVRRPVGETLSFRSSTAATRFRRDGYFEYDQTLSLIQPLARRRDIVWQIGADGVSEPTAQVTLYYAQISWRSVVHHDWLVARLRPQWRRAREDDFSTEFRFYAGFDVLFGHYEAY